MGGHADNVNIVIAEPGSRVLLPNVRAFGLANSSAVQRTYVFADPSSFRSFVPAAPEPVGTFVGCENEVASIANLLEGGTCKDVLVWGIGGIGKTEVALAVAERHFAGRSFMVGFSGSFSDTVTSILSSVVGATDGGHGGGIGKELALGLLKGALRPEDLLVIDNVDRVEGMRDVLDLPCHVLMTARREYRSVNRRSLEKIELEPRGTAEAVAVFEVYYCGCVGCLEEIDREAVEDIVALSGGHMLAIELLAKTCRAARLSPASMLEVLESEGFSLEGIQEKVSRNNSEVRKRLIEHIASIVDLSLIRMDCGLRGLLAQLSVLDLNGVPLCEVADWCGCTDLEAVNELEELGILKTRRVAGGENVHMHVLVAEAVRYNLRPDAGDIKGLVLRLTSVIEASDLYESSGLPLQVSSILGAMGQAGQMLIPAAAKCSAIYRAQGSYTLARIIDARRVRVAVGTRESPSDLVAAHSSLCLDYRALGDYPEAMRQADLAISLLGDPLSSPSLFAADALNSRGIALFSLGDYEGARDDFADAASVRSALLGSRHPDVADSLNNLGVALREAGDYTAAQTALTESLGIKRDTYGDEDARTAETLNNLAGVLRRNGDTRSALRAYIAALRVRRRTLAPGHPDIATSYNNIALALEDLGKPRCAKGFCLEAAGLYTRALGPEHAYVAAVHGTLARICRQLGEVEEALDYANRSLTVKVRTSGPLHRNTVKVRVLRDELLREVRDGGANPGVGCGGDALESERD